VPTSTAKEQAERRDERLYRRVQTKRHFAAPIDACKVALALCSRRPRESGSHFKFARAAIVSRPELSRGALSCMGRQHEFAACCVACGAAYEACSSFGGMA
jgi:hypothetical protein